MDVKKTYRLGEAEIHALQGVDMEVKKGEMIAITGPSGSGKSTILNLIGALDEPTSGKIYVSGKDLSAMSEGELTDLRRLQIGFVFQFYNLIPVLTAYENVELPLLIGDVPKGERAERVQRLLEMVGLLDRAGHRPDELSGGERQRVAIARAIANHPAFILADEPTGDLDSKTGKQVVLTLRDLVKKENVTVIMVTHDLQMANLADKILDMRDGIIAKEIPVI